jgi:hypothetical protein
MRFVGNFQYCDSSVGCLRYDVWLSFPRGRANDLWLCFGILIFGNKRRDIPSTADAVAVAVAVAVADAANAVNGSWFSSFWEAGYKVKHTSLQ